MNIDEKGSLLIHKPMCVECVYNKAVRSIPEGTDPDTAAAFLKGVRDLEAQTTTRDSTCTTAALVETLYNELIGPSEDYTEIKEYYNAKLLEKEDGIDERIAAAEDPFGEALRFSMTGNYIDFIALDNVDDDVLEKFIEESHDLPVDPVVLEDMRNDVLNGKSLVFLTDNCGEVVFDKLFLRQVKKMNPDIDITVIVRSFPVVNDATMEDAVQVGLDKEFRVIENGTAIGGTPFKYISEKALKLMTGADVIISKGMGNFETLEYENINCYFIFLCKCDYFAVRFDVPKLTGMVLHGPCDFAQ